MANNFSISEQYSQADFVSSVNVHPNENVVHHTQNSVIVVIDPQTLDRECLVRTIEVSLHGMVAHGYESIDAWLAASEVPAPKAVLYRIRNVDSENGGATDEVGRLVEAAGNVSVVVIGDSDDIHSIIAAFDSGAKTYLPSSVGFETILEATRLSMTSGVFLPVTSLKALRAAFIPAPKTEADPTGQFTARQLSVCEAMRRGKSNKTIAYELGLCESTVKVHVRSIMKRLRVTNRTEAAYKLNAVYFGNDT
ncbi:MAG: LuxR C-terminal-related transcriptional regulator [Paracoccaceae bacterium]